MDGIGSNAEEQMPKKSKKVDSVDIAIFLGFAFVIAWMAVASVSSANAEATPNVVHHD